MVLPVVCYMRGLSKSFPPHSHPEPFCGRVWPYYWGLVSQAVCHWWRGGSVGHPGHGRAGGEGAVRVRCGGGQGFTPCLLSHLPPSSPCRSLAPWGSSTCTQVKGFCWYTLSLIGIALKRSQSSTGKFSELRIGRYTYRYNIHDLFRAQTRHMNLFTARWKRRELASSLCSSFFSCRTEFPMVLVANKADLESERVVRAGNVLVTPSLSSSLVNDCVNTHPSPSLTYRYLAKGCTVLATSYSTNNDSHSLRCCTRLPAVSSVVNISENLWVKEALVNMHIYIITPTWEFFEDFCWRVDCNTLFHRSISRREKRWHKLWRSQTLFIPSLHLSVLSFFHPSL